MSPWLQSLASEYKSESEAVSREHERWLVKLSQFKQMSKGPVFSLLSRLENERKEKDSNPKCAWQRRVGPGTWQARSGMAKAIVKLYI